MMVSQQGAQQGCGGSYNSSYSKRRRNDIVPLHPVLVKVLKEWLATRGSIGPDEPVFALVTNGGGLRRTSKMMQLDLARARGTWIKESESDEERKRRRQSDCPEKLAHGLAQISSSGGISRHCVAAMPSMKDLRSSASAGPTCRSVPGDPRRALVGEPC